MVFGESKKGDRDMTKQLRGLSASENLGLQLLAFSLAKLSEDQRIIHGSEWLASDKHSVYELQNCKQPGMLTQKPGGI